MGKASGNEGAGLMRDDGAAYKGVNYLIQDEAARRMWESIPASYPLKPVPPSPGPKPPWWRWQRRRWWKAMTFARSQAKAWNFAALFAALYGANVSALSMPINRVIVFDDSFPWTRDAFEQMFPPGKCDENHTQT